MKKKTMVFLVTLALFATALSGCGSSDGDTEVTAGDNQRLAYAVVTSMEGNEMTYMEVDESQLNLSDDTESKNEGTSGTESSGGQWNNGDQRSSGGGPDMNSSEMPQFGNGEEPQMSGGSTETQQSQSGGGNEQMPQVDSTEMPTMQGGQSFDSSSTEMPQDNSGTDATKMSGTTATVQIPVGVTVHTTADTNTTFSRIQSGDILKLLFETDDDGNEVIVEIWMVQ